MRSQSYSQDWIPPNVAEGSSVYVVCCFTISRNCGVMLILVFISCSRPQKIPHRLALRFRPPQVGLPLHDQASPHFGITTYRVSPQELLVHEMSVLFIEASSAMLTSFSLKDATLMNLSSLKVRFYDEDPSSYSTLPLKDSFLFGGRQGLNQCMVRGLTSHWRS